MSTQQTIVIISAGCEIEYHMAQRSAHALLKLHQERTIERITKEEQQ